MKYTSNNVHDSQTYLTPSIEVVDFVAERNVCGNAGSDAEYEDEEW